MLRLLRTSLLLVSLLILKQKGSSGSKEDNVSESIQALATKHLSPRIQILSSMNEKQISAGDIVPCWFTLQNAGERHGAVDFKVRLPVDRTTYLESSVFPPQENSARQETTYIDTDSAFVVRWPEVAIAPGQSRVFNVDIRIKSISETSPIDVQGMADIVDSGETHDTVESTISFTKRPKITQELLNEQRAKKFGSSPARSLGSSHQAFEQCKRVSSRLAAVEKCLHHCQTAGQSCLGCGFDQRAGCVCKSKEGGDRLLDDILPREVWEDKESKESKLELFDDRRGEILVFPRLLSDAQVSVMESFLSDLVHEHSEQRMILEATEASPLHGLIKDILPISDVHFENYVTFSEENVEVNPHFDAIKGGETHKLLLFLDEVAGTRFWESKNNFEKNHCPLVVKPSRGTVVIFPMSLYHDSERFQPRHSIKRTLGLRIRLPHFDMAADGTIGLVQAPMPIQEKL